MYPERKEPETLSVHNVWNRVHDAMTAEIYSRTEVEVLAKVILDSIWVDTDGELCERNIAEAIQKSIRQGLGEKVTP